MYVCVRVCMMVNYHHEYTHKRAYNYSEYVILRVKAVSKHVHIPHYTPNYIHWSEFHLESMLGWSVIVLLGKKEDRLFEGS